MTGSRLRAALPLTAIESYYRDRGYVSVQVGQPEIRPLDDSADGRTRWVQLRIPEILIIASLVASVFCAVAGVIGLWGSSNAAERGTSAAGSSHTFVTRTPQRFNSPDVYRIGHGATPRFTRGGKR
jgi:hypothetical protein